MIIRREMLLVSTARQADCWNALASAGKTISEMASVSRFFVCDSLAGSDSCVIQVARQPSGRPRTADAQCISKKAISTMGSKLHPRAELRFDIDFAGRLVGSWARTCLATNSLAPICNSLETSVRGSRPKISLVNISWCPTRYAMTCSSRPGKLGGAGLTSKSP